MKRVIHVGCYFFILLLLALASFTSTYCESSFFSPTGIWSVLPPLIAIALAFLTRNVIVSLLTGVFSAAYLLALESYGPVESIPRCFLTATEQMRSAAAKPWNCGVLLQCATIGGLVGLITRSGGVRAVAEFLAKFARGPVSSQIVSWFLGFFIFFDDYANVQIRGPIMRPLMDRSGTSREKFAFILDSTAAPIAGIALISTWIGTEISYIRTGLSDAGIENISAYTLFVESIPYRFYNLLTLAFVLGTALTLREFGPMRRAEVLARKGFLREMDSRLIRREEAETAAVDGGDPAESVESERPRSLLRESMFAIIPLLSLVVASFVCFYLSGRSTILSGEDAAKIATARAFNFESFRACIGEADASIALFQAALFACVASFIMCVASGKLTASQASQAWLSGVKSLCFTFVILILAWSLSACISKTGLGTANFLVTSLSSNTPTFILPSFIFVLAAIVSFATGTSYGTMAIITPLAIPFAHELLPGDHAYLVAATSAVLTGAIFGDHCSPISDTTILSSTSARCGLLEHVSTQLGYALWIAGISIVFGFLPVGLGVSLKIALPVSLVACLALIFILGRKVPAKINDEQK